MDTIDIKDVELQAIATQREKQASNALSMLAKRSVTVKTVEARAARDTDVQEALEAIKERMTIAYSQILSGLSGMSFLALSRDDALQLVDLFNGREKGTTLIMQEIDRSTIKETLNILANAYVTELANKMETVIRLDTPRVAGYMP